MLSRVALSALLLVAGGLHLLRPSLFDPAIPFEEKLFCNYAAGVLEVLLAVALWPGRTRDAAARATALWFLLLLPIHVYVSARAIPLFGVTAPWVLWLRTALQPLLYFWALSLQERGWVISQRWSDVLFLHYEVDAEKLAPLVPYPLDRYQGKAIVSIVPFVMSRIRFPFLPPIPGLSRLVELNLRTYVRVNGTPGVYFLTLDTNHLPGVLVARALFGLPYRWRRMRLARSDDGYRFRSAELELLARISGERQASEFQRWASERYALFTRVCGIDLIGEVEHAPWSLTAAQLLEVHDVFSQRLGVGLPAASPAALAHAAQIDVRFRPFRRCWRAGQRNVSAT